MSAPQEKLSGDVAVSLDDVQAELKVKVESWGAKCRLTCLGSEITVEFHVDGGVEVIYPEELAGPGHGALPARRADVARLAGRVLPKHEVAGSSPVVRSQYMWL
jgi:hypothetical protein